MTSRTQTRPFPWLIGTMLIVFGLAIGTLGAPPSTVALSATVVIGQVYGGGGNSGAPLRNDFVELFNRGSSSASLAGWSVQYASATASGTFASNAVTALSGSLAPGRRYLVQLASGGTSGVILLTPDAIGTVNMSATSGKVALVNSTAGLACNGGSTPCDGSQVASIVDLVGWGSANFFEGSGAAPATTAKTAVHRALGGCTETDTNASDFAVAAPDPRNTAALATPCGSVDAPPSVTLDPADLDVIAGATATFSAAASGSPIPTVQWQASTDHGGTWDNLAGATDTTLDFTAIASQNGNRYRALFSNAAGSGTSADATLTVTTPFVVISQVYGGGGNLGATLKNDFIELFNRGATAIDLSGWSVQYAATTGVNWSRTNLVGSIAPGQFYLIRQAAGVGGTLELPTPDASGTIMIDHAQGKVVLVSNQTTIAVGTSCPARPSLIDLVGYGSGTNCYEGPGSAGTLSNVTAAVRRSSGRMDTDDNGTDFLVEAPNPRNSTTPEPTPTPTPTPMPTPTATPSADLSTSPSVTPGPTPDPATLSVADPDLQRTDRIEATVLHMLPGAPANFSLHSSPIALGTVLADSSGVIRTSFPIPSGASNGQHTLVVDGRDASGAAVSLQAQIVISGIAQAVPNTAIGHGSLNDPYALVGLMLLAGGLVGAVIRQRRVVRTQSR